MNPAETLRLLHDDTLDEELRQRKIYGGYSRAMKKALDPDAVRNEAKKSLLFKDLGFSREDYTTGAAEAAMVKHWKLHDNYSDNDIFERAKDYLVGLERKQANQQDVFEQVMDEQFNKAPEQIYSNAEMQGHRAVALNAIRNLSTYQRQFLENVMPAVNEDGFMFGGVGEESTEIDTKTGVANIQLVQEAWAAMSPVEKDGIREFLPAVAKKAWERSPERAAAFDQMMLESVQSGREEALSGLARFSSYFTQGLSEIGQAFGGESRFTDEEMYRAQGEAEMLGMLRELRTRRRDKMDAGKDLLGIINTTDFKKMLAGTIGEMATLAATGPMSTVSFGERFMQERAFKDPDLADDPASVIAALGKGWIYQRLGKAQIKMLTPKVLGGRSFGKNFGVSLGKRVAMEGVQEVAQDALPMLVDELHAALDERVSRPEWGQWVEGWKDNAPEAILMFAMLGAFASGADIATTTSRANHLADQTSDTDALQFAGVDAETAEDISGMESPVDRLNALREASEAGKVDMSRELDPEVVTRVIEKARSAQDPDAELGARPIVDVLPNDDIRVELPTGDIHTVKSKEEAEAVIENYRGQLKETARQSFEDAYEQKMEALTQTEISRIQEMTGQRIDEIPEEKRSFAALRDAKLITDRQAHQRIKDLAYQQVASGEVNLDRDEYAATLIEAFDMGKTDFQVEGQADPDARIENGTLRAGISINPDAGVEAVWEEGLENHMHAMLNGKHYELSEVVDMIREVEQQTGKEFLANEESRESVIEAFSFIGKAYATGEMKTLGEKLKNIFDTLLQVMMQVVGLAKELENVRAAGLLNPELEANIRAGLGIDGNAFYQQLTERAEKKQGVSNPQVDPTNSISIQRAADLAQADGVKVNQKKKFYGDVWISYLRKTGDFDEQATPEGMRAAANAAIDDLLDFMDARPEFLGYYNEDWAATRSALESHYGAITENDFAMYQFLVGVFSPSTPLNKNILESLSAFDYMMKHGNYSDAVRVFRNPKTKQVKGDENILNPQGPTWVNKARNVKDAYKIMADLNLDWVGFREWMGKRTTAKDLKAYRLKMGYAGLANSVTTMSALMMHTGEVGVTTDMSEAEVEAAVRKHARNKESTFPNGFFFAKKVGPYTLGSMGFTQYSTVDIWESRAIRSYLGEADPDRIDLPADSEDVMFGRFIMTFKEEFAKRFPHLRADVTDLQALRWFNMIEVSNRAGFKESKVETISEYTRQHLEKMGSTGFRGLATKLGEGDKVLPATLLAPERLLKPPKRPSTFAIANRRQMFDKIKSMPDGFTVNPRTGELVETGWVVAPRKHTETELPNMTFDDFNSFIDSYRNVFENDDTAHFGGWLRTDDDTFVLDVVTTYDDGADAAKVAEDNDQDAIFGLDNFDEVKRADYGSRFPGFETRSPREQGVAMPLPNYSAPVLEHVNFEGTDYEARFKRETVDGIGGNEMVHFTGHHTPPIDRIKVQVAGDKGAEKKAYREYPEIYTKRAYVAFNGYKVESQYGVRPDKGYRIPVHHTNWYPSSDPLNLHAAAKAKASAMGYAEDSTAISELYMSEVRDAGFLGFKAQDETVGVIFHDIDVEKGWPDPNPAATFSIKALDDRYQQLIEEGDLGSARQILKDLHETRGMPPILEDTTAFDLRRKAPPSKTVKAYKLFRMKDGELYPLFVGAKESVPMGQWLDAKAGPETTKKTGTRAVKSTLGPLAYRPGWHAGDTPLATHIGIKKEGKVYARRADEVWAEVEMAADQDWQTKANENGMKDGRFRAPYADVKEMPVDGHYRYKTNPNMTGEWLISGTMKVNKILTEAEANAEIVKAGQKPMPWDGGKLSMEAYGLEPGEWIHEGKIMDITYGKDGKPISLLKRFTNDPRATFSIRGRHPIKGVHENFNVIGGTADAQILSAQYDGGKGYVQITKRPHEVSIDMLHAESGSMARGIINDLKQEFSDRQLVVEGSPREWKGGRFWEDLYAEKRIEGRTQTYSITGKKGGKKVPAGKTLLGIVDDNMRVKTKLGPEKGWYHDQAFGSYASSRAMSRFRVLDDKTILFMDDPGVARDAINFELEYLGYEIKTVQGAGRSNWSWSIREMPKWPGTKDGGKLAKWFDDMDVWESQQDPRTPILFEHGDKLMSVVINLKGGYSAKTHDPTTRDVVDERAFDSRLHAVAYAGKEGAQPIDYFDYRTFSLNPRLQTLTDKVIAKAAEMDVTGTPGGLDAMLKMAVNLERLIERNNARTALPNSKVARDRLSLTQDLAAYDAMLKALPPEVRAKMGGWATLATKAKHETRIKFLNERLPMMEKHLDRFLREEYLGQIDHHLKRQKVKIESGILKGKDADMHQRLSDIESVMDLDSSDLDSAEREVENALAATADPDEVTSLTDRLVMLQMFGGLRAKGKTARPARAHHEALTEVEHVINVGLTRYQFKEVARAKRNAKLRESIIDDISQGEGLIDPSEIKRRQPNLKTLRGRAKKFGRNYFFGLTSWEWMLNWAMGKQERALKNENVRRLSALAHNATHKERRRNYAKTERMSRFLADVFGVEVKAGKRWRLQLSRKLEKWNTEVETGIKKVSLTSAEGAVKIPISKARLIVDGSLDPATYKLTNRDIGLLTQLLEENDRRKRPRHEEHLLEVERQISGPTVDMRLSKDQALYLVMMWRQDGARDAMQRWGYTDDVVDQMVTFMGKEGAQIEAFLRNEYDQQWHELNPVYRDRFGVNMPRVKNYSPTSYIHKGMDEKEMLLEDVTPGASLTPGFAKARQNHRAQPREDQGALLSYTMNMRQTSHFISWAGPVGDMRAQLQHKDVQQALEGHTSPELKGYINERIQFFADGGNRVKSVWWLDAIRKKFTVLALSYNWSVMFKQLTSQPAFLFDNPPIPVMGAMVKNAANMPALLKWAKENEFVRERFLSGYERDVTAALNQKTADNFNWFLQFGMWSGRLGDIVPVVLGGKAVYDITYDSAIRRGAVPQSAAEEAQLAMEMSVERAQQAGDTKDLSSFQQGGSPARLFTMFLTSPLQYYMNTYHALANIKAEGGKVDMAKRVFISHILLPWAFQLAIDLTGVFKDDEDDDLINPADYVRAMLLGPLNGMFVAGHGVTMGVGHATNALFDIVGGEDAPQTKVWDYSNPVVDIISETTEGIGDGVSAIGKFLEEPSMDHIKELADGAAEAAKLWGPAGSYDVSRRVLNSVGLEEPMDNALRPEYEQLADEIRAIKKGAYSYMEEEYKAASEALKADKTDEDAKDLKKEIQEGRWERFAEELVLRLRGRSTEDITKALESLPENHIPAKVKKNVFPELDYEEPE